MPGVPSELPSFGEFRNEPDEFFKRTFRDCVGVFLSKVKDEFRKEDFRFPVDISLLIALFDLEGDLLPSNFDIGESDPNEFLSRESSNGLESCF